MLTPRSLPTACGLGIVLVLAQRSPPAPTEAAQAVTMSSSLAAAASPRDVERTLITGNHILDQQGIVDAYGHLSARHPTNASLFLLSRQVAPGLVASPAADLVVYRVADGEAAGPEAPSGFIERYIHSEIYRAWPRATSVLHSRAAAVLPYTTAPGPPLRALVHMADFVGAGPEDAIRPTIDRPWDLWVRKAARRWHRRETGGGVRPGDGQTQRFRRMQTHLRDAPIMMRDFWTLAALPLREIACQDESPPTRRWW